MHAPMAQYKYDLYTVPTEPKGPPRHHPWYRERLQLKFLKTSRQSAALDGARWVSLAGDIDDFRSGVPAQTKGSEMVKKTQLNPVPLVDSRSSEVYRHVTRGKERRPQSKLLRHNRGMRTLYQRVGPRRQMQREHVGDVEANLLEHPLGLYPHLEEAIAPELLKDVVGIIDPDLKAAYSESELSSSTQPAVVPGSGHVLEQVGTPSSTTGDGTDTSAPCTQAVVYRWPLKQSEEEQKREQSLLASQQAVSPTQESRVNHVTHGLVQWVRDLGGSDEAEQYSIDEATIKSLFGSDYETRPTLTAPIRVVDLVNVPEALRLETREHTAYSASSSVRPSTGGGEEWRDGRRRRRGATFPGMEVEDLHCVRTRYGAWYLPVSLWRPRPWDEPLCDPRQEATAAENEVARRNQAMDEMLAGLHGTHAFREFVVSRRPGANVPMFLRSLNADDAQKQAQSSTRRNTAAVS